MTGGVAAFQAHNTRLPTHTHCAPLLFGRKKGGVCHNLHPRPNPSILDRHIARIGRENGRTRARNTQQEGGMSMFRDKYKIGTADFFNIRNRNESRVVKALDEFLRNKGSLLLSSKDIQDVYALALNMLPPRYAQRGTIVLRDPVTKDEIHDVVEDAYAQIMERPKP